MFNLFPDSPLHCYYNCSSVTDSSITRLFTHYITEHKHEKCSIRQLTLNDQNAVNYFPNQLFIFLSVQMQYRIELFREINVQIIILTPADSEKNMLTTPTLPQQFQKITYDPLVGPRKEKKRSTIMGYDLYKWCKIVSYTNLYFIKVNS